MKKILAIVIMAVMCFSLSACSGTKEAGKEEENKNTSITLSNSLTLENFYPIATPETATSLNICYWSENFYDTLVEYDDNGKIIPNLATEWKVSDDGLTYTFTLRDDVKFSDGTVLTAEAVVLSYNSAIKSLGQYNGSYGKLSALIANMEAPDEHTFVMTLTSPYYNTLGDLTMNLVYAILNPKAVGEDVDTVKACSNATMGTGAYMFSEKTNDGYVFALNPYYWGEKPDIESFTVKVIEDNDARILALRNGEIDAIIGSTYFSSDGFNEMSNASGFGTMIDDDSSQTRYLGFNLNKAPFNDENVRLAVAYALDQQSISKNAFNSIEDAAETMYPSDMIYCGDSGVSGYETDTEKAESLLEDAGWVDSDGDGVREKDGNTLSVTISYITQWATIDNAVMVVADQLEKVGFKVTVSAEDMMTNYTNLMSGAYDFTLFRTNGGAFDPASGLTNMCSPADPVLCQFQNFLTGGADIITELDSTSDANRVQEIYNSVMKDVNNQVLMVPVSYVKEIAAWNSDVIDEFAFSTDPGYITLKDIKLK